ncbi:MAG: gamma-glutamyl-gamma-aminobutyrate hydrolase family protein [Acidobacteria bacterium]|nr:gamma-glutamyl-gamma-aminobutyrate hydrolase family protein [Acidobacteriota bacterium]MBS1866872.1 gamma-glutamyl-gamma-aminobutyrate hydrolase family protein [Acidobacteriota bacterium]
MPLQNSNKPRIGIPWRTSEEESKGVREKLDNYFAAVRRAGAEPTEISLKLSPSELSARVEGLDGFVLPGSPADVEPSRYGAVRHEKTKTLDPARDRTDSAILDHAIAARKPLLGICYGCQILNVHQRGTLVQDIPAERPGDEIHGNTDLAAGVSKGDAEHDATLAGGSLLAKLAGSEGARINSSHHQAIDKPGDGLRVTARSAEGIVEGVELDGAGQWVVGVQWHPERMPDDAFAQKLFGEFVAAVERHRGANAAA